MQGGHPAIAILDKSHLGAPSSFQFLRAESPRNQSARRKSYEEALSPAGLCAGIGP
jgi:hypothetical protein